MKGATRRPRADAIEARTSEKILKRKGIPILITDSCRKLQKEEEVRRLTDIQISFLRRDYRYLFDYDYENQAGGWDEGRNTTSMT